MTSRLAPPVALLARARRAGRTAYDRVRRRPTPYVDPTEQLVVEIFVRDMARSRAFYEGLGFAVRTDRGAVVVLAWEGHRLFLDERRDLGPPPAHLAANVRVMVPDVDRHWARAQELGARVVEPIGDRDYRLRDFTIADPDGFGVRFGTRLPPPVRA